MSDLSQGSSSKPAATTPRWNWGRMIEKQVYDKQGHAQTLFEAYHRCRSPGAASGRGRQITPNDRTLVLISGPSGVGKTSLALTLEDTVQRENGFFCQGKFDQHPTAVESSTSLTYQSRSYGPFVSIITNYVHQVKQRGSVFSKSIQATLNLLLDASEREVLEESIPALRQITRIPASSSSTTTIAIDEQLQQRWRGLKGLDAEKRYMHLFTRLVQAICSPDHPIVMLIDDVQWADPNSIELLKLLTTSCTQSGLFLIICTARSSSLFENEDEQETKSSIVNTLSSELNECGVLTIEIKLNLLNESDVTNLLSDLLQLSQQHVLLLSSIVHRVTQGNIFFIVQFMNALQEEEIVCLNSESGRWCWDDDEVKKACYERASLTDFLAKRILKLTDYEQRLLKTASCLGATLYEKLLNETVLPPASVRLALLSAKDHGLIHFDVKTGCGSFAHDRIHEATYSLIPKDDRAKMHLDIGLRLWIWLPSSEKECHLFTIVGQIIHGLHLLNDPMEKEDLAKLMLRAGQKAAQMSSFAKAAMYFNVGVKLLRRSHWKHQYDLSLALYNAAVEVEYYNGNTVRVDLLLLKIFQNATSLDHKLQAYCAQIYSMYSRDNAGQAFAKGLEVLALLGVTFPGRPGKVRGEYAWGRCRWLLQGKDDNSILNLPAMTDSRNLVIVRLLALTTTGANLAKTTFIPLLVFKMIECTLRHGISEISMFNQQCQMIHRGQSIVDLT